MVHLDDQSLTHTLEAFGKRLADLRLSQNRTQAQLSAQAGISVSALKRLEWGANTSLETVLRVLAALGLSTQIENWLPATDVRPLDRVRLAGRERQRARPQTASKDEQAASDWAWGDESADEHAPAADASDTP